MERSQLKLGEGLEDFKLLDSHDFILHLLLEVVAQYFAHKLTHSTNKSSYKSLFSLLRS